MYVRLVGQVALGPTADALTPVRGAVQSALVARLALARNFTADVDELVAAAWSERPADPRNIVQVNIGRLRRQFGDSLIVTVGRGYRLGDPLVEVDLVAAELNLGEARSARSQGNWKTARDAAERWRALVDGVPLEGLHTSWAEAVKERVGAHRQEIETIRAEAFNALGRFDDALGALEEMDPAATSLDERVAAIRMRALAGAGRRADALAAYDTLRHELAETFGVDPSAETAAEYRRLLAGGTVAQDRPQWALPRLVGPTFGREAEQESLVAKLLEGPSATAILGMGGIGKTRFAVEVATELAARTGASVWFVDVRGADDASSVKDRLAAIVAPGSGDATSALGRGRHLVLFDNAESAPDGVAELVVALADLPDVSVLVTSRVPIDGLSDRIVRLGALPTGGAEAAASLLMFERVRLHYEPDQLDAARLAQLASLVHGVPLAVELLAAELRWRSPAEVERRFLDTVGGAAQPGSASAALRSAIGWALEHVSSQGRRALTALGILLGDFSVTAAGAVIAAAVPDAEPLTLVAELVDASLLQRIPDPREVRLRLLDPVRNAAAAELPPEVAAAHARHYLTIARQATDALETSEAPVLSLRSREDRNVLAALEWAWQQDPALAFDALADLGHAWAHTGRTPLLDDWTARIAASGMLAGASTDPAAAARWAITLLHWDAARAHQDEDAELRAIAERGLDTVSDVWQFRWTRARVTRLTFAGAFSEARSIWLDAPLPPWPRARVHRGMDLQLIALQEGSLDRDLATFEAEVVTPALEIDEPMLSAWVLTGLAYCHVVVGDLDRAEDLLRRAEPLATLTGVRMDLVNVHSNLAWVHLHRGAPVPALAEVLVSATALGDPDDAVYEGEILLIAGLAYQRMGLDHAAAHAAGRLRIVLAAAAEATLDTWAEAQADSLLAAYPDKPDRAFGFAEFAAELSGVLSGLRAERIG